VVGEQCVGYKVLISSRFFVFSSVSSVSCSCCSSSTLYASTYTRIGGHGTFVVGLGQINDEGQRQSGLDPDVLRR
jgi:hypothetical protein